MAMSCAARKICSDIPKSDFTFFAVSVIIYVRPKQYKSASEQFFLALFRSCGLSICILLTAPYQQKIIRKSLALRCEQFYVARFLFEKGSCRR